MIEFGPPKPNPVLFTRGWRIVERGATLAIVHGGGGLSPTVATVTPYRDGSDLAAQQLVAQANEWRTVIAALRLLYACAHAFRTRPSVKAWRDLGDACRVAREALSEPKQ